MKSVMAQNRAELTMTMVVGAVLAILVLAVLSYIFVRNTSNDSETLGSCGLRGGTCVAESECTGQQVTATCSGDDAGKVCCVSLSFG